MVTLAGSRVKNGWLELKAIYWPKMGNRLVPVRNRGNCSVCESASVLRKDRRGGG